MHREDPHRLTIGLRALDVAIIWQLAALGDPAPELRDELVQITPRARDLFEQQLEQVRRVDHGAFATTEHQRALGEATIFDHAPKQRLVRAPARERRPIEEPRDQWMVIRCVDNSHQIGPRYVEEPRPQGPHARGAIARCRDRREHVRELVRFARLEQSIALDERTRQSPRAQRPGDAIALSVGAGEHHAMAEREPGVRPAARPDRRRGAQRFDLLPDRHRERLPAVLAAALTDQLKDGDRRPRPAHLDLAGRRHWMVVADRLVEQRRDPIRQQDPVDRLDHRFGRAPVHVEVDARRTAREQLVARADVGRDVRASEAIDRLLRIADDRQPLRALVHPDRTEDVPLHRIGILELVDHHPRRALAQPLRELATARAVERLAHEREHVVVIEHAALGLVAGDPREHLGQHHGRDGLVERGHRERTLQQRRDRRELRHLHDAGEQLLAGRDVLGLADRIAQREHARRRPIPLLDGVSDQLDPVRAVTLVVGLECDLLDQRLTRGGRAEHGAQREPQVRGDLGGVRDPWWCILARTREQQAAQLVDGVAAREIRGQEVAIRREVREPLAQQRGERPIEGDLVGDLGLLEEPLRGERILHQHAITKPVDREDRCVVEPGDRIAQPLARRIVDLPHGPGGGVLRGPREPIEQVADPQPQLGDRLVRERDEQDLAELRAGEHEIDDAMLEEVGLARAGGRLDDHEPIGRGRQRLRSRDPGHGASSAWKLISPVIRSASGPSRDFANAASSPGSSSPYGLAIGP